MLTLSTSYTFEKTAKDGQRRICLGVYNRKALYKALKHHDLYYKCNRFFLLDSISTYTKLHQDQAD